MKLYGRDGGCYEDTLNKTFERYCNETHIELQLLSEFSQLPNVNGQ